MNTCLRITKKQKGFSLIELLVVISIIGILAAIIVPSFNSFNRRQTVKQAAKQLKADLRLTQNRAVSSIDNSAWGVRLVINSTSYQIAKFSAAGNSWNEVAGSRKTLPLPTGVRISAFNGPNPLVFERLTGIPTNAPETPIAGSRSVSVNWASGALPTPQTVTISIEGNIE